MADQLYLSLWFPNFRFQALPAAIVSVLRQFTVVGSGSRISAATAYPLSWNESPVYQRVYSAEESPLPEEVVAEATEHIHEDFAYEIEVKWELWTLEEADEPVALDPLWKKEPRVVRVVGFGPQFDEGSFEQNGHVRLDFGSDTPFLQEEAELDTEASTRVRENVQQLVDLIRGIERHSGISSRLLWSESGESLAEKLVARLQRLN